MSWGPWKYTDQTRKVVVRAHTLGAMESCIATRDDVLAWVTVGNSIEEPPAAPAAEKSQVTRLEELEAKVAALEGK